MSYQNLVSEAGLTQKLLIHGDKELFQHELKTIFARNWLFLTHDSLIPSPGDYVTAKMGVDEVIVSRQNDGSVRAFLNVCRHRGKTLVHTEAGNAKGFVCGYHGWGYGSNGELQSVPFEKELYGDAIKKKCLGLKEVPRIESFHGFIYGCFDAEAPPLIDYLGDAAWYLEPTFKHAGGLELVGPPGKVVVKANWKPFAENFVGDEYHVGWTHAAALRAGQSVFSPIAGNAKPPPEGAGLQMTSKYGSGMGLTWDYYAGNFSADMVPDLMAFGAAKQEKLAKEIGDVRARIYRSLLNGTVFPNNSFLTGSASFKVWNPIDENTTEVWTYAFVEKDMPEDLKRRLADAVQRSIGPAGFWESDDNENMETLSQNAKKYQSNNIDQIASLGFGKDVYGDECYPGVVGKSAMSETSYRGFYRAYQAHISSSNWAEFENASRNWHIELTKTTDR
ncbi:aromatic ring-hydroxylating dioxygenase subunit alpha [Diaphorobacter sp. JS3051]|uniref:aromatic ring-hydroxylating oxygenase subunit alpha n=1 Tax=Diaphorobacter sp. JS3051 TaxID=2792224 RepID=UPI0018C9DB15|nr:aromatic ring-hydroxylating dioxygenase subunit alpha [Diaphorobacter sp. JS3051]QPN31023.1 aromatic ring-hydroxylating dioxygenase subunit alpha [Diaphorobacter sp. JS3051]